MTSKSEDVVMSPEGSVCCGTIEYLAKKYGGPYERPISFNFEEGELGVLPWSIRCYYHTPSGRISQKRGTIIIMEFCPFCGKQISGEEKNEETVPPTHDGDGGK